jgi:hypothetical protein
MMETSNEIRFNRAWRNLNDRGRNNEGGDRSDWKMRFRLFDGITWNSQISAKGEARLHARGRNWHDLRQLIDELGWLAINPINLVVDINRPDLTIATITKNSFDVWKQNNEHRYHEQRYRLGEAPALSTLTNRLTFLKQSWRVLMTPMRDGSERGFLEGLEPWDATEDEMAPGVFGALTGGVDELTALGEDAKRVRAAETSGGGLVKGVAGAHPHITGWRRGAQDPGKGSSSSSIRELWASTWLKKHRVTAASALPGLLNRSRHWFAVRELRTMVLTGGWETSDRIWKEIIIIL